MQWNEKCFAENQIHDALKPPGAKRLCPKDFFGEAKFPGRSNVLGLKTLSAMLPLRMLRTH